jgi:D-alanyl-D-alanine carboxypeptidase
MKWKNHLLIVISCILFTGCSPIDSFFKKGPSNEKEKQVQTNRENKTKNNNKLTLNEIFFNDIKEVNGKDIIQNPSNVLALVNKQYFLPDTYIPAGLTRPNVAFSFGNEQVEKAFLRKDAADALTKMFNQAKKEGIELFAVSGYRSFVRQKAVFDAEVTRSGKNNAVKAVAIPGASEHQSGLAMDISSQSNHLELNEAFSATNEGKWLAANAHRFGFILRYPKGKEAITHYEYEPWHFRYVGVKAATIIYQREWTLEEYFNEVKKV